MPSESPFLVVFIEDSCLSHLVHGSSVRDVAVLRCVHRQFRSAHTFMIQLSLTGWLSDHHPSLRRIQKLEVLCERRQRPVVFMTGLDSLASLRELKLVRVDVSLSLLSSSVTQLTLWSCHIGPGPLNPVTRLEILDWHMCTIDEHIDRVLSPGTLSRTRLIRVYNMEMTPHTLEQIGAFLVRLELSHVQLTDVPRALVQ